MGADVAGSEDERLDMGRVIDACVDTSSWSLSGGGVEESSAS